MNVNDVLDVVGQWDGDLPVVVARNENGAVVWDAIAAISLERLLKGWPELDARELRGSEETEKEAGA